MATVKDTLQSTVYTILTGDTNVTAFTDQIMDGMPSNLVYGGDGSFILIHTPRSKGKAINMANTKFRDDLTLPIEIFSRQENVVRKILDAVSTSLIDNQNTTRAQGYWKCNPMDDSIDPVWLPGESSKPVWRGSMRVSYLYVA